MYLGTAVSGVLHLGLLALALAPARPEPIISPDSGPPVDVQLMSLNEYNAAISSAPELQSIQGLQATPAIAPPVPESDVAMALPEPTPAPPGVDVPSGVTLTAPPIETVPLPEEAPLPSQSVDAETDAPELELDERALQDRPVEKSDILPEDNIRVVTAPEAPQQPRGVIDAPQVDTDPDEPPEEKQVEETQEPAQSTDVAEAVEKPRNGAPPMEAPLPRAKPRGSLAAESTDEKMLASPVAEAGDGPVQRNVEDDADSSAELARELLEQAQAKQQELAEAEAAAEEKAAAEAAEKVAAAEAEAAEAVKQAEAEAQRIAEEDARIAAEDARIAAEELKAAEAEKAAEELAAQKAAAAEKAVEELAAKKAAEDAARKLAEAELEDAKRKAEEELAAARAAEEDARKRAEAELAAKRAAEDEARKQVEAELAAQRAAEEEAKKQAEAELAARREAEAQLAAKRAAEAEAQLLAQEQLKMQAEMEAMRRAEAEAQAQRRLLEQQAAAAEQQRIADDLARRAYEQDQARKAAEAEAARQYALRQQQLQQYNQGSQIGQQADRNLSVGTGAPAAAPQGDQFMAMLGNAVGNSGGTGAAGGANTFSQNVAAQNNAAPLSPGEQQQLLNQLSRCWRMMGQNVEVVTMRVSLTPDGRVSNAIPVGGSGLALEIANRALQDTTCQPFQLPPQKYGSWRQLDIVFDPRRMTLQ